METYAIIGFVVFILSLAIWLAFKMRSSAIARERAVAEADAHKKAREQSEANDEWTNAERDRQLEAAVRIRGRIRSGANRPTEPYLPTQSDQVDPADARTRRVRRNGASLLLACPLLALSTGCTRTVYVEARPPEIPVEIQVPALEDSKEDWQVFALTILETIERYNEEFAR